MSDELVEFLRARFDEDESVARAAALRIAERAVAPAYAAEHVDRAGQWVVRPWLYSGRVEPAMGMSPHERVEIATVANDHIARHDPARVLAEVAAKRRILDEIVPAMDGMDDRIDGEWGVGAMDPSEYESIGLLRLLARSYADHPDYREEWKP